MSTHGYQWLAPELDSQHKGQGPKKGKVCPGLEGLGSSRVAESRKQVRTVVHGAKLVPQLKDEAGGGRQPC